MPYSAIYKKTAGQVRMPPAPPAPPRPCDSRVGHVPVTQPVVLLLVDQEAPPRLAHAVRAVDDERAGVHEEGEARRVEVRDVRHLRRVRSRLKGVL